MAEVVETYDLTAPSQDGWAVDYRIRREDGEELHAEVRCWGKARDAAQRAGNANALAAIADRGKAAALEYAELVESPATRGAVLISIWSTRPTRAICAVESATSAHRSSAASR